MTALAVEEPRVEYVAMLTPSHAVDLFLGDLQRKSRSRSGRTAVSYRRLLDKFVDHIQQRRGDVDVAEITVDDCNSWLTLYADKSQGYQYTVYFTLRSYFKWLYLQDRVKRNPLDKIAVPRRIGVDDLDVTSVSTKDVARMLAGCDTWSERITLSILAYLGPRRNALAGLRLSDYDREERMMRFREKGTKTIWKPVPDELADILETAIVAGGIHNEWQPADPYLVPPEGPLLRADARDDRVIWRIVKKVAYGVGVNCHVHALRAAFAIFYLETHEGNLVGLQKLMGHASPEVTRAYMRRLDDRKAMESVRSLSWSSVLVTSGWRDEETLETPANTRKCYASSPVVGAGGFEPPNSEPPASERAGRQLALDRTLEERARQASAERHVPVQEPGRPR